jgi:type II secretory pathway pseudopilin PulG
VELLVVIGIIAILAALLMPAIGAARRSVREGAISTELHNMDLAMTQYYQDWGRYPPDMTADMESAERLVYYLGTKFRVTPDTAAEEVGATKNGGPYYNFKPTRLTTDPDGDGNNEFDSEVYLDQFGVREGIAYYQFDNNDDDGGDESNWHPDYETAHNGWNVSNIHPTQVDIWSAGNDGQDAILDARDAGDAGPTGSTVEDFFSDADDLGNW